MIGLAVFFGLASIICAVNGAACLIKDNKEGGSLFWVSVLFAAFCSVILIGGVK